MSRKSYPNVNAANQYARDVVRGKIVACQFVIQACQRHLDDLMAEKSKSFRYRFDKDLAERAAKFIQLLPHTKGEWAFKRMPITLEPWQLFVICCAFGWVNKGTRLRRFREVYTEIPRKNGKSAISAGVALYCFACDNEFGAEVYSGATTEKQAWEVFRPARLMCKRTPMLTEAFGIEVNASNMNRPEDGARFEPLIGNPGDGSSPHCAVVDEYHEHATDALYTTMLTGMGARRQPLMWAITTAGYNIEGPCYDKRREVIEMLNGSVSGDKGRMYVRFVTNGNFTAWSEPVVSGWNQDVTVRSLTSTTPSKLGGGRIDVLGSTSDYDSMNCTVRGVDSSGTNSAWSVGTSVDTGKTLYLKNHRTSSQVLISGDTGSIKLQNGNANKELALTEDSVTSNADIILKNSDDGSRLLIRNSNTSAQSWSIRVWGQSGRESVFEIGNTKQYMFYAQETASGGRNFDFNGDVTCKTLYQTSDQSLKDNIKVIGDATESIRKMNGYTYTFKDDGLPYAGVIAQEVMDALPEAIAFTTLYGKELQGPTTDGNVLREEMKCLSVDYAAVTGLLVQVARETDDRVTALEEENTTLRENLATADT
ncbi:terminase large subunit, partial [Escherichia coli]|nr:terminase large subunit [Escherichia coli]